MGLTIMPRLPHSKGLDQRVSEPEDLELLAQPGEGGRGVQVGKGVTEQHYDFRKSKDLISNHSSLQMGERVEANCSPRQILLWPRTQFPNSPFLSVSIV